MPLDASIPLSVKGIDFDAVEEFRAKRAAQQAAEARASKIGAVTQGAYDKGLKTPYQIGQHMAENGLVDEGTALMKEGAGIEKTRGEIDYKTHEDAAKQFEIAGQIVSGFASDPTVNKQKVLLSLNGLHKSGVIDDNIFKVKSAEIEVMPDNPGAINQWANTTLMQMQKSKDLMAQMYPDANARLTAETARRGQDITQQNNLMDAEYNKQRLGFDMGRENFDRQYKGVQLGLQYDRQNNPTVGEGKPPPAAIQTAYINNKNALNKVNAALESVDNYPDAFGLKNMLGDTIRQRTDEKGVNPRAMVADIGSLVLHDRSGAAVTAAETPRLKPFIPNVNDTPETIKTKLMRFKQEYEAINNEFVQMHPGLGQSIQGGAPDSWIDSAAQKHGISADEYRQYLKEKNGG